MAFSIPNDPGAVTVPAPGICFHAVARNGSDQHAGVIWRAVTSDAHVIVADVAGFHENRTDRRRTIPRAHFAFYLVAPGVLEALGLQANREGRE